MKQAIKILLREKPRNRSVQPKSLVILTMGKKSFSFLRRAQPTSTWSRYQKSTSCQPWEPTQSTHGIASSIPNTSTPHRNKKNATPKIVQATMKMRKRIMHTPPLTLHAYPQRAMTAKEAWIKAMTAIARMEYQKIVERRFLNAWHIADLEVAGVVRWRCGMCVKVESVKVLGRGQVLCLLD